MRNAVPRPPRSPPFGIMNAMSFRNLILTALFGVSAVFTQPADLIRHHGKIVTVDPQFHIGDTIAVRGDRVIGVGSHCDIGKLAGANTRQIGLQGKTVPPRLMDSPWHAADTIRTEFGTPVPAMET